jgi:hypothetical protein
VLAGPVSKKDRPVGTALLSVTDDGMLRVCVDIVGPFDKDRPPIPKKMTPFYDKKWKEWEKTGEDKEGRSLCRKFPAMYMARAWLNIVARDLDCD